jgi:type IV pilus assembly protein PilF
MAKFQVILLCVFAFACSATDKKKETAALHLKIGTGYLIKGHSPQAIAELQVAERLDPDNPVVHNNLGLAYFMRKEYQLAQKHLEKALDLSDEYSDARNNLGRLYIELARYDAAISELSQVVKDLTYPNPEKAHVNLGLAYLKKGDANTAQTHFRKSMEANTKFCPAHNYYGQALFQMQKYEMAIDSFETALKLCNNNYDEPHYFSALSYFKTGQKEKAQARLEEVANQYPQSEYSQKARSMLRIIK